MRNIIKRKIVIFGAGKIGLSFIGQLFSKGGYEVVFVDINKTVIDELNKRNCYQVIIKSDTDETLNISNVRGIHTDDIIKISNEIATANLVAVSVGQRGLNSVLQLIVKGLVKRFEMDNSLALDIIIAENLQNARDYFYNMLINLLPPEYPMAQLVGLVETSIGKMVPLLPVKDLEQFGIQVFAEEYNTLIIDKKGFKNAIPEIAGLSLKDNFKAWVDRKLFIHNLGHACVAYFGYMYNPKFIYVYEALEEPFVFELVKETMIQSANVLLRKYPGEFSEQELKKHIDDLLFRFQNRALGDTIFRVGCDLRRKLGAGDRLAGAIKSAINLNRPYSKILFALVCGFHFKATDENGKMFQFDQEFFDLYEKGTSIILTNVCGFNPESDYQIFNQVSLMENLLVNNSGKIKTNNTILRCLI